MEAKRFGAARFALVGDDERTSFDRRDVLVRMKAEGHQVTEGADVTAFPARADDQRGVFDYPQPVPARKAVERVHVDQRSGIVGRHDRASRRRDRRFDLRQIDVARDEIAFDKDGPGAHLDDHVQDGEEARCGRDDLIAGSDAGKL